MAFKTYVGGNHRYDNRHSWTPTGSPQNGDVVGISSGTVTASGMSIDDKQITISRYSAEPVGLVLRRSDVGATTSINTVGEGGPVPISTASYVTNFGSIAPLSGTLDLNVGGCSFINAGTIHAKSGLGSTTVDVSIAQGSTFINSGLVIADGPGYAPGGIIDIAGTGAVINDNVMRADAGTMTLATQEAVTNHGVMAVSHGGTINLETAVTSGTIDIDQGMLEFGGGASRFAGPNSLHGFTASIWFSGASGDLKFDSVSTISELLNGTDLLVFEAQQPGVPDKQIADLHLIGGVYSAASFTVVGNDAVHFQRPVV